MLKLKVFLRLLFLLTISAVFISAQSTPKSFRNPVLKAQESGCVANNLRPERFKAEITTDERIKLCLAINKISFKLNSTGWSPQLNYELKGIWDVFSNEDVSLRLMPKGASSRILAQAEPFPSGVVVNEFEADIYIRPERIDDNSFFQVFMHELRHIYDFYRTWDNKTTLNSLEVERRAFLLMGKISQEIPENVFGIPKFWKESWRALSREEITAKREAAVNKYLQDSRFYQRLAENSKKSPLDFSSQATRLQTDNRQLTNVAQKSNTLSERRPDTSWLLQPTGVLPQNVREASFNLTKPQNSRDEKEILRIALQNEKKLYYGMSNFIYDQKLEFQCWQKGKISASFSENNTVARSENGNTLFQNTSAPLTSPCTLDSRNLQTDFSETFWVSPALEKMPIEFTGFVEVGGLTLARYTVHQPDTRLFNELAKEYQFIKPFRVFVGTIFVSPQDGQIVRFWGTSFPENTVTGGNSNSQKVWGTYSVTALRQKLNIDGGLWVTVYVSTVAIAEIAGSSRPFSYSVKFENYRQSKTDVKIFDDDDTALNSSVKKEKNIIQH
jgi:hypothetical protein